MQALTTRHSTRLTRQLLAHLAVIALAVAGLLSGSGTRAEAASPAPATLAFLDKAFVNNEISLYGSPEYGVTIEAMLARRAGGYPMIKQLPQIKRVFTDRRVIGYSKVGYLYTKDGALRTGRTGMFLFASKALGVANGPIQNIFYAELKASIGKDGSIPLANGNSVEYAWVALGLHAYKQDALAQKVLAFAESRQNADGGFAGWSAASSVDGTGLMLQAQAALRSYGGAKAVASRKISIGKAVGFLRKVSIEGNHWRSDNGDGTFSPDVNGTAYATMGLKAIGVKIDQYSTWLKAQVAADGGIKSAWSGSAGDVFATAQGYAPMIGKSYVELLTGK